MLLLHLSLVAPVLIPRRNVTLDHPYCLVVDVLSIDSRIYDESRETCLVSKTMCLYGLVRFV